MRGESSSSAHPNRLKFLCSFGGRILPRPPGGHLKYVGGETRVVVTPRPLSFSELRQRVAAVCDSDVVIKYQLMPEDLDALVSIRSDEDVRHMVDEYDRLETTRSSSSSPTASGSPRFRVYLFPSNPDGHHAPAVVAHCGGHLQRVNTSLEQRYIDAINGVWPPQWRREGGGGGGGVVFTVTSPGSSPGSASCDNAAAAEPGGPSSERFWPMHKAHSSPNLQQLVEGGPRLHRHHHHHQRRLGSPQRAPYAGASGPPTARMGGGCPHCQRAVCSRLLANRRHGPHAGMRCHVDEPPCWPRWSGDGCRGIRYP